MGKLRNAEAEPRPMSIVDLLICGIHWEACDATICWMGDGLGRSAAGP